MICPKVVNTNGDGLSFKKAGGPGYIQVKCEEELSEANANVCFRFSIGNGTTLQPPRGPVFHNFSSSAVWGLARDQEEWDFSTVMHMKFFLVCLQITTQLDQSCAISSGG